MPFVGRDWRDNGELWRKTDLGSWQHTRSVPYASLSDVFIALDIINSVHDHRRFHYIIKFVQILFNEKLSELTGNVQRYLFAILEQMIERGEKTGDHLVLIERLLNQAETSIRLAYPFYTYIGSSPLWDRHFQQLQNMKIRLQQIRHDFSQQSSDQRQSDFDLLPVEMQYEILRRLDDGVDLLHLAMINRKLYRISQECELWKQLCIYHFPRSIQGQIDRDIDWKKLFFKLQRQHGLKENFAETIYQCQTCKVVFWQNSVHQCLYDVSSEFKSIGPRTLISMFI